LKEYIRLADFVRVYSGPLRERAARLNSRVVQVSAPIDLRLIVPARNAGESGIVKIVYATSRLNDSLADIFMPAVNRILRDYAGRVRVCFLGYQPPGFHGHPDVIFKPMIFNYNAYLRSFSGAGYDIGLAPLLDDVFHRSKTNNKFREYGASRIAGIYSDVTVYSSCVTHRATGLLVKNRPGAWYDAMAELIENPDRRLRIQEQAHEYVRLHYSQEAFTELWRQHITQTAQRSGRRRPAHKAVEKLINTYVQADMSRASEFLRWLLALKLKPVTVSRLRWVWQRFENVFRIPGGKGLLYNIVKIRQYAFTYWLLWEIRLRLFSERHLRWKG
jgi:hypothetical protein